MTLSDQVRARVRDLVELAPTKNSELQARWDMDDGSEVHAYLESELKEYYYRDANSLICATPKAEELVGGDSGPIAVTPLQAAVLDVLGEPEDEPMSVVTTLHTLQDHGHSVDVDAVRSALRGLADRGLVDIVRRTVPTYRLAQSRANLDIDIDEANAEHASATAETPSDSSSADTPGGENDDELVADIFDGER